MRIIVVRRLREFATQHADAGPSLVTWETLVRASDGYRWDDVRATFGVRVDRVALDGGREAFVFNVHGNAYRLIVGVRYAAKSAAGARRYQGEVFIKEFLTHTEYDTDRWKERF